MGSAAGDDWLDSLAQAVLAEQAKEAFLGGTFAPYLGQLTMVRAHLINGESEAVYPTGVEIPRQPGLSA